jgi:hypothetical protein
MILFLALLIIADFGLHCALPSLPSLISFIEAVGAWDVLIWRAESDAVGIGLALELGALIGAAMWRGRRGKPR